jgi:hypothetical protein
MLHPRIKASAHPSFYRCASWITVGQCICQTTGPGSPEPEHFVPRMHKLPAFCGILILSAKPSAILPKNGLKNPVETAETMGIPKEAANTPRDQAAK